MRIIATERELVIDESSTAPGRGAYLHRSLDCLASAVRRRALARALRVPASTSDEALRASFARVMSTNSSGAVE